MKKIILIIVSIVLFSACTSNKAYKPARSLTWGEIQEELKKRDNDIKKP